MRHSALLHDALTAPKDSPAVQCDTDNVSTAIKSLCSVSDKPAEVSLPIVPVIVRGSGQDKYLRTYALLDSGSSNTFCSTEVVSKLGLKGKDTRLTLETVNQESDVNVSELSLVVSGAGIPKRKRKSITLSRVYALGSFPRLRKSPVSEGQLQQWRYVSDLGLALDIRKGNPQEPFAVRTVLGWTLNGPLVESDLSLAACNFIRSETEADVALSQQVERFWKLDVLPTSSETQTRWSQDDKKAVGI